MAEHFWCDYSCEGSLKFCLFAKDRAAEKLVGSFNSLGFSFSSSEFIEVLQDEVGLRSMADTSRFAITCFTPLAVVRVV